MNVLVNWYEPGPGCGMCNEFWKFCFAMKCPDGVRWPANGLPKWYGSNGEARKLARMRCFGGELPKWVNDERTWPGI